MNELTPPQEYMRQRVLDGGLDKTQAVKFRSTLDTETPFIDVLEFITALASLVALFWHEVTRKTFVQGARLSKILWRACAPRRVQYYLNNMRFRHSLPCHMLEMLGSGTSTNETLHNEINTWFRQSKASDVHVDTRIVQLHVNTVGKLVAHNDAMYKDTSRQYNHDHVLRIATATLGFDPPAWEAHADSTLHLPRSERKRTTTLEMRERNKLRRITFKRPAALCAKRRVLKPVKRTPFNRLRR